ncbi:hypothetical protein FB639_004354 [Coemansia asiatica]|nr:hypothetical protein FB639_004354 [Coemansia asiatica]
MQPLTENIGNVGEARRQADSEDTEDNVPLQQMVAHGNNDSEDESSLGSSSHEGENNQQAHSQVQPVQNDPLRLDESELDAIARITPRVRSPITTSEAATSPPRTPVLPPSIDDLMTFASEEAPAQQLPTARTTRSKPPPVVRHTRTSSNPFYNRLPLANSINLSNGANNSSSSGGPVSLLSDTNPFRHSVVSETPSSAALASSPTTSPASLSPPARSRRRPPPPPPPAAATRNSAIGGGGGRVVRDRSVSSAAAYTTAASRPSEQN